METKIENIVFDNNNGMPTVSSVQVAESFEKQHKNVIRDIEKIIAECAENRSAQNRADLFITSIYTDNYGRMQKCYEMTRDEFALLAMGFTGDKALEWKLRYINAFNQMEKALKNNKYNNLKDIAQKYYLVEKDTYKYSEKDLSVWQSCVANNAIRKIAESYSYSNNHVLSQIYKKMYELFGFDTLQAMKEFSEKHGDEFQKCTYLMAVADDANYREMFVRSADELLKDQEEYQQKAANVFSVEDKQNVELDRYGNPILFQYLSEDDYISLLCKVSKQIGDSSAKKLKTSKYIYDKMYDSEEWQIIQDCWHCRSKKNLVTSVCRYAERFIEVCRDCTE